MCGGYGATGQDVVYHLREAGALGYCLIDGVGASKESVVDLLILGQFQ